ncbi:hypothetical protein M8J76_014209 [Diaphorina citri]|nr:hypothetical protein M8J75_009121 [Diaphorina citri]KAI5733647.1 hypothetical protein M8J76_014209 [Diaphorina citri]
MIGRPQLSGFPFLSTEKVSCERTLFLSWKRFQDKEEKISKFKFQTVYHAAPAKGQVAIVDSHYDTPWTVGPSSTHPKRFQSYNLETSYARSLFWRAQWKTNQQVSVLRSKIYLR